MTDHRPHISDLFDLDALQAAIDDGFVREQTHPDLPLKILNYTERTQYERAWTHITETCRGLIIDAEGRIVARPFAKFFNYSEHPEGTFDLGARVTVTDKLDGSLGILYPTPDGYAIATRGSFTSDQAEHATKVWRERYAGTATVDDGITWLFEIIYPANRIVCDYGGLDDLVLLGGVHHRNGVPIGADLLDYPGPKVTQFDYATLAEALAAPPRPGAEGIVIRFHHDATMIKLKQETYLQAHAIVTRTSTKTIWQALASGEGLRMVTDFVPDEFLAWTEQVAGDLQSAKDRWISGAVAEFACMPRDVDRKTFAQAAVKSPYKAALFRLLDGRSIDDMAWKAVEPVYERPYQVVREESA